jgi:alanine racemase
VIHIETGLNRLGFRPSELAVLSDADKKQFLLVMSHLACADEKDHFMNEHQVHNFITLKEKYFPNIPGSLSASDGIFLGGAFLQNMVRLGAAMYGINTAPYRENQMKNVVSLYAPVLQVEDLPAGEFVGYSATYRAASNRRLAIVSIGYGDGLPRSLSNVGKVFFKGKNMLHEARILGRVSMDNIICDVTTVPDLKVGDEAVLLDDFYTLDDLGRDAGTISYEIISRIGKNTRFIRKYKK